MLKNAMKRWNIDIKKSFLVGDRSKDIEAGNSIGAQLYLLIIITMN